MKKKVSTGNQLGQPQPSKCPCSVLTIACTVILVVGLQQNVVHQGNMILNNGQNNNTGTALTTTALTTVPTTSRSVGSSSLAYKESYGFFDDVSDDTWKRFQVFARKFGVHRYTFNPLMKYGNPPIWYYNNYEPYFSCPEVKRVFGIGDGPKWTCNVHRLKTIAQDYFNQKGVEAASNKDSDGAGGNKREGCLVYSIGSNGNYEWEDGMVVELGGPVCEIHIFDYSNNYDRPVNKEKNMHFHQWGFRGSKPQELPRRANPNIFFDLYQVVKKLGHEDRVIDIFKMDCEGCEWTSYYDWVPYQNIRQVLVETHQLPSKGEDALAYFDSFRSNNLVMYSKEVNPWGGGNCFEFSYVRLAPSFLTPA